MSFFSPKIKYYRHLFCIKLMFLLSHVIEVETEVIDKLKYIEETKEIMDKNSNKLSEIKESMNEIFAGKMNTNIQYDN